MCGCTNTHTHNHTNLLSSTTSPTQTHMLPTRSTTPHPSAITSHRIFIRTAGQRRTLLEGTLDAVLICLVAQVVVHFKRAFMEFQVSGIPQLPQEIGWLFQTFQIFIRTSPCLSPSKLGHSTLSLSAFLFLQGQAVSFTIHKFRICKSMMTLSIILKQSDSQVPHTGMWALARQTG